MLEPLIDKIRGTVDGITQSRLESFWEVEETDSDEVEPVAIPLLLVQRYEEFTGDRHVRRQELEFMTFSVICDLKSPETAASIYNFDLWRGGVSSTPLRYDIDALSISHSEYGNHPMIAVPRGASKYKYRPTPAMDEFLSLYEETTGDHAWSRLEESVRFVLREYDHRGMRSCIRDDLDEL